MPTPEEEKLQYLKREEIRTMSKDASALRESEAQRERQRVAKIRVGEERQQEPARQQAAAQAAQQRVETTKQARQKEEELIKSKEERLEIQQEAAAEAEKQLEQRKTAFGQQLERVQVPEEQARRNFLERVAAKAEGIEEPIVSRPRIPVPEIPTPPTPPAPVQPTSARRPVQTPVDKPVGKPGGHWTQIAIILASLAMLGAVGTFWYWYFMVREEAPVIAPIEQPEEPQEPVISTPQINDELINAGYRVPETPRTINTIIIHSIYNILEGSPYSVSGILGEYKQFNVAHHYLIDREGNVYRIVAEENIAYHAGPSRNSSSIGIGIINTESDTPAQTQYESLAGLILDLQEKYGIAAENIVRRQDVVTGASNNPANFDWQYFMSLIQ